MNFVPLHNWDPPVADLENFTWGGKGVARDLGRVAGEDGTWKPSYIN